MKFQFSAIGLACVTLLTACGGGGGAATGTKAQSVNFLFPGARYMLKPAEPLVATTTSGLPVTFSSNTPSICTVDGTALVTAKAGECSITASQAGDSTYMASSSRQLFNVLKHTQSISFTSPGFQSITGTPPALVATSESGLPVSFSSTTPDVCTTSGTTLTLVSKGTCSITASEAGNDSYAAGSAVAVFVVGDDKPPVLTVMSGFKSANETNEGGSIVTSAGSNKDGWWCSDPNWCSSKLNADGSFTFQYVIQPNDPKHPNADGWISAYFGFDINLAGVSISSTGNTTTGLQVDKQSSLKLTVGENAEWFTTATNNVKVVLVLGHYVKKADGSNCNIAVNTTFKPKAAALTEYEVQLADFAGFENSCDLPVGSVKAADELATYPIVKVQIAAANPNTSVQATPDPNPSYPTALTVAGGITIQ